MLKPYAERVRMVELNTNTGVVHDVDIVLYDTFAQSDVSQPTIDSLVFTSTAQLVVYTWRTGEGVQAQARRAGAAGLVFKGATARELVTVIEHFHHGQHSYPIDNDTCNVEPRTGRWPGDMAGLSSRESEVLALICLGLSNEEIATRTYLSINTVKTYIRGAYRKIDVNNRPQAVLWGLSHGFEPGRQRRILRPVS